MTETGVSGFFLPLGLDGQVWSFLKILIGGLWAVGGSVAPCAQGSLLKAEW